MSKMSKILTKIGAAMLAVFFARLTLKIVLKVVFSILGIVFSSSLSFVLTGAALFATGVLLHKYASDIKTDKVREGQ